jgi:RimJ/RimL family protein N-acetyltransferase
MGTARFASERLSLRALEADDVEALQAYLNEPAMIGRRYIPWAVRDAVPLSRRQIEEILDSWAKEKKAFTLGIELRETGELVGHAGCSWGWDTHCPGVSVVVAAAHQRTGIGSDTLSLLLKYLLDDTPAHNVNSWIASWNEAGLAFARKHGFTESGRIPRGGIRDGAYYEEVMVDILKREWTAAGGDRDAA